MNSIRAIAALGIPLLGACSFLPSGFAAEKGSGTSNVENRHVAEFTGVKILLAATVKINVGRERAVQIKADDNLLPLITTEVRNGIMEIGTSKPISTRGPIEIEIGSPHLSSFALNGAGKVVIEGLREPALSISLDGAGDIAAAGSAKDLHVAVNGTGRLALFHVQSKHATASLNGAGKVELNTTEALTASLNGVGAIRYRGNPKVVASRNGVGKIGPD